MAITRSAKKRIRQNERRYVLNLRYKRRMKRSLKEVRDLLKAGKNEEARQKLPTVYKMIDKAAKRGIIKKNNAARKKSRITKGVEAGIRS